MRVPLPGPMKNDGTYGGFGARAAHKPWTPGAPRRVANGRPVPEKYRRPRLRRTRRSRMEPTPEYVAIPVAIVGTFFAVVLILLLLTQVF